MCLSIPGKVVKVGEKIIVDYSGEKREADLSLVEVKAGDYVIVSNKVIITKITEEDAIKSLKILKNE